MIMRANASEDRSAPDFWMQQIKFPRQVPNHTHQTKGVRSLLDQHESLMVIVSVKMGEIIAF